MKEITFGAFKDLH